jgi:predicted secreted protein
VPHQIYSASGLSAALLAATLLTGCGQQPEQQQQATPAAPAAADALPPPAIPEKPRAAPTVTLTEADEGRALSLQRGQVVEIRLSADRPAGFTWIPAHNALPVLATDGIPEYETQEGREHSDPGIEVWRFIGREPGHAHLVFEYRRPFEADLPPQASLTFHFDVE